MTTSQQDRRSLRIAIVRALQLADALDDHLVSALLAQALDAAENELSE